MFQKLTLDFSLFEVITDMRRQRHAIVQAKVGYMEEVVEWGHVWWAHDGWGYVGWGMWGRGMWGRVCGVGVWMVEV